MKKATFQSAKVISIILGSLHLFGLLFFGDYFSSKSILFLLFTISTGLSLIVIPLISEDLLKSKVIRILATLLGMLGILNNMYSMGIDITLPNSPDIPALIMRVAVLAVLVIMIYRTLNPKIEV